MAYLYKLFIILFIATVECHINDPVSVKIKPLKRQLFINKPQRELSCYSCHDESPYCGNIINNPASIATAKCQSKCFIRKQDNKLYRGCYDGWMSTKLKHDYNGCRRQNYMGSTVEWCLCDHDYCNGRSMSALTSSNLGPLQLTTPIRGGKVYRKLQDHVFGFERQPRYRFKQSAGVPYLPRLKHDARTRSMCSRRYDGIYADPGNCRGYIDCVAGRAYRRHCSPGTVWSNEARRCDFPDRTSPDSCQAVRFRVQKRKSAGYSGRRQHPPHPYRPPHPPHPLPPTNQKPQTISRSPAKPSSHVGRTHFHISKFPIYNFADGDRRYNDVAAATTAHSKNSHNGNYKTRLSHDHRKQQPYQHRHQQQHSRVNLHMHKDNQKPNQLN